MNDCNCVILPILQCRAELVGADGVPLWEGEPGHREATALSSLCKTASPVSVLNGEHTSIGGSRVSQRNLQAKVCIPWQEIDSAATAEE